MNKQGSQGRGRRNRDEYNNPCSLCSYSEHFSINSTHRCSIFSLTSTHILHSFYSRPASSAIKQDPTVNNSHIHTNTQLINTLILHSTPLYTHITQQRKCTASVPSCRCCCSHFPAQRPTLSSYTTSPSTAITGHGKTHT